MKSILYICTPNSIHDIKWMSYFSDRSGKFKVYATYESNNPLNAEDKNRLSELGIELLPALHSFSVSSPVKTFQSIRLLKRLIKEKNIDLVHILFASPYSLWGNYITCPFVITTRGSDVLRVIPNLIIEKGPKQFYFKRLYKLFYKSFNKAAAVTCTSFAQVEKVKSIFNILNPQLIRTGVDVEAIIQNSKNDDLVSQLENQPYIFSPRFMSPIYNIHYQLEAIAQLPKEILEKYEFVFIRGNHFEEGYFQEQIKSLEILKNTIGLRYRVLDYLDQKTLWEYFKHASLTVMTPVSDGTPNSALEAMASRCPLIVSDLQYDKELFEGTCVKVPLDDAEYLSNKIEDLINSENNDIVEAAFTAVKIHGDREVQMKKLEEIYLEILS